MEGFLGILSTTFDIIAAWWWVVLPIIFGFSAWNAWLYYIRIKYIKSFNWVLLDIIIPQDVLKTPLAMEQIFAGLHSVLFPGSPWQRYVDGRVQEWFSLEIVSFEGDIHFYIYTVDKFKDMVESHIYAQYPDAEIHEVEDYTKLVPQDIPNKEFELTGAEFVLSKEDAYPIRVWRDFEFETKEGEANVDPLAGLIENLARLGPGEQFWLQIGIKPIGDDWHKEGIRVVDKLIGRRVKDDKKRSHILEVLKKEAADYASGVVQAPFKIPEYQPLSAAEKDESGPYSLIQHLSPGEREVVEAIERNIAKIGFETSIRAIYLARREVNNYQTFFSVVSAFRQFSTQNLNHIKWNRSTLTFSEWPIPWPAFIIEGSNSFRRRWLIFKYRYRFKPEKSLIFSIEELATIFHFPGRIVTSPTVPRIETKKGEPPSSLPVQ